MRASASIVVVCTALVSVAACGGESTSSHAAATGGSAGVPGAAGAPATTGGSSGAVAAGGAGGEAAPFTGNLPPGTVLGGLTDAQYTAYCEQAATYVVAQNQDALCRYAGASQANGQAAMCTIVYSACLAAPPTLLVSQVPQIDCSTKPQSCTATAAMMDACVTGLGTAAPADTTPPCSNLTVTPSLPALGGANLPVACVPAMGACRGFLTGGGQPGAGGAAGAPAAGGAAGG